MAFLELVTIIVSEYDPAIASFVDVLGFELVAIRRRSRTTARPKRWVVVRPPDAQTGIVLARADGEAQRAMVGGRPRVVNLPAP